MARVMYLEMRWVVWFLQEHLLILPELHREQALVLVPELARQEAALEQPREVPEAVARSEQHTTPRWPAAHMAVYVAFQCILKTIQKVGAKWYVNYGGHWQRKGPIDIKRHVNEHRTENLRSSRDPLAFVTVIMWLLFILYFKPVYIFNMTCKIYSITNPIKHEIIQCHSGFIA